MRYDLRWKIETEVVPTLTVLEDETLVNLGLWGSGDIVGILSKADPDKIECLKLVEAILHKSSWHEADEIFAYSAWKVNRNSVLPTG